LTLQNLLFFAKAFIDRRRAADVAVDDGEENESDESDDDKVDRNCVNTQYENLQEQFEEYKQSKEIEICALKMDLERTKRQLADLTQGKLDLLLKNQQSYHNELVLRLFPNNLSTHTQTADDFFRTTPDQSTKKRKLPSSPSIHHEYEYYS
jgi:hypothetical protein